MKAFRFVIVWGMVWAAVFVLAYQAIFALAFNFTPCGDDGLYSSNKQNFSEVAIRVLGIATQYPFPIKRWAQGIEWSDPIIAELVYVPYLISIQYFLFGCLFGFYRFLRWMKREASK
jgi:hypothetical protein